MTRTRPELAQEIFDYLRSDLLGERQDVQLTPEDDVLGSGLVDSLGVMSLVSFIEKQYGISVPPVDVTIENFMSVDTLSAYVERRQREDGHRADD